MKLGLAKLLLSTIITATLALSAGCAYIKTTQEARDALRGDINKVELSAEMPPVDDQRTWEQGTWEAPNYNVHMFGPAITDKLRADLLKSGLFAALPSPNSNEAQNAPYRLEIKVTAFSLEEQGSNVYRVPQVIVNGALLPAFALTNLATMGQVDMAGYVMPSVDLGTKLNAGFTLIDKESEVTVLSRSYISKLDLGAVSQKDIFKGSETGEYGVDAGASKAEKAIEDLADLCVRDPAWKFTEQYKAVALAKDAIAESMSPTVARCETALLLLPLLEKPNYTAKQVKLLHDDLLDADIRAALYNEMRARSLGYDSPEEMPQDQKIDEKQAEKLLDDISLLTDIVLADLDTKVLEIAIDAVIPPQATENKDKEKPNDMQGPQGPREPQDVGEPEGPPETAAVATPEMREAVLQALVQSVKNDLIIQNIITDLADKKIGDQWPEMKRILEAIDSPVTKRYLSKRTS